MKRVETFLGPGQYRAGVTRLKTGPEKLAEAAVAVCGKAESAKSEEENKNEGFFHVGLRWLLGFAGSDRPPRLILFNRGGHCPLHSESSVLERKRGRGKKNIYQKNVYSFPGAKETAVYLWLNRRCRAGLAGNSHNPSHESRFRKNRPERVCPHRLSSESH